MVITDPKAEILRKTGNLLKQKGYEVIVFDLINPAASFCYNPFVYVYDDREVLTLIENLIQNTTPPLCAEQRSILDQIGDSPAPSPHAVPAARGPAEEQNFPMVMEMIAAAEVHEDDDNYQSPLDILFERLEMREPDTALPVNSTAFSNKAAGKTAKSILVSVGVRLAAINLPSIAKLTMTDELHLQELGVAQDCAVVLHSGFGQIPQLSWLARFRRSHPDTVPTGRPRTQRTLACAGALPYGRVREHFLAKRHLFVGAGHHAFPRHFLLHHRENMAQLKAMYKDDW